MTYTEYRIVCKKPRARTWQYLGFSGAKSTSKERVEFYLRQVQAGSPAWKFKLQKSTVTVSRTDWEDER